MEGMYPMMGAQTELESQREDAVFGKAASYEEMQNALNTQGTTDFITQTIASKKAEFDKDANLLRKRLQKRRGFINPRRKHVQYWDLTTAAALLYTCLVTPFEVGAGLKTEVGGLFIVNTIINFIFIFDIALQARLASCSA